MLAVSKEESHIFFLIGPMNKQKDWKCYDSCQLGKQKKNKKTLTAPKAICANHRLAAKLHFNIRIIDSKKDITNHQRRLGIRAVICSDSWVCALFGAADKAADTGVGVLVGTWLLL